MGVEQPSQRHLEIRVAKAVVAHLTHEADLLKTDPVRKWASTRWPTFVQICQYVADHYVGKYGDDKDVMPLGKAATDTMLLSASMMFQAKGMDWGSYYNQTGSKRTLGKKFPQSDVQGWNTIDHGVNNAEGALNWPATSFRVTGNPQDAWQLNLVFEMLDKYQGQIQSLFCADEVFCGRAPHRGTETCAVVEAMASLEHSFAVLGNASIMDRVERLAFNAMPAALAGDMWTHVYVQQSNSVFAGRTKPTPWDAPGRGSARCGRDAERIREEEEETCTRVGVGDSPSREDESSNFFGVSHFPCCITNFPQGWPKFAMSAIMAEESAESAIIVASFVPAEADMPATVGGGAHVITDSQYPFSDSAIITVTAKAPVRLKVRIPGWADHASLNGHRVENGTYAVVQCAPGKTVAHIELNPTVRLEYGWGSSGTNGLGVTRGPLVFALHPAEEKKVVKSYEQFHPVRPLAVDYEISTSDAWNYGLATRSGFTFVRTPSSGWNTSYPFVDNGEYPFYIKATGRTVSSWGYWSGSMITDVPPPSPINCTAGQCGNEAQLRLVPFGLTNIRISVFPWIDAAGANEIEYV